MLDIEENTDLIATLVKRYRVKTRTTATEVGHPAYDFTTIVQSDEFVLFEIAIKAYYIHMALGLMRKGDFKGFAGLMVHMAHDLFTPYGVDQPYIADEWAKTPDKCREARQDYLLAAALLSEEKGKDALTGEERNLYYALLD